MSTEVLLSSGRCSVKHFCSYMPALALSGKKPQGNHCSRPVTYRN